MQSTNYNYAQIHPKIKNSKYLRLSERQDDDAQKFRQRNSRQNLKTQTKCSWIETKQKQTYGASHVRQRIRSFIKRVLVFRMLIGMHYVTTEFNSNAGRLKNNDGQKKN